MSTLKRLLLLAAGLVVATMRFAAPVALGKPAPAKVKPAAGPIRPALSPKAFGVRVYWEDKLYVHAGANEKTWARDRMLRIIRRPGLPIETQPGLNPHYSPGLTPDGFGDHTAFNVRGHPDRRARIDELGDRRPRRLHPDGAARLVLAHPNDTLEKIEELFPGRPMERLRAYTKLTYVFLATLRRLGGARHGGRRLRLASARVVAERPCPVVVPTEREESRRRPAGGKRRKQGSS